MSETTKDDLLAVLQQHIGAARGIKADALASALGINKRDVRQLVTELRLQSVAVCGTPKTGYFIAETEEELITTCEFLHRRGMHSITLAASMKKAVLPDLAGQQRLQT